jgi:hypothetical protein
LLGQKPWRVKFIGSGVIHALLLEYIIPCKTLEAMIELTKNDQMEQPEVVVVVIEEGVETLTCFFLEHATQQH